VIVADVGANWADEVLTELRWRQRKAIRMIRATIIDPRTPPMIDSDSSLVEVELVALS
jgi:hypothetical protein